MRTLVLLFGIIPTLLSANGSRSDDLVRTFAVCAGRLTALMEHQWLFDDPEAQITEAQRGAMVELLEAVMPSDQGREVLHWRVQARAAHSALLSRASFNENTHDAAYAVSRSEELIGHCTSMLVMS